MNFLCPTVVERKFVHFTVRNYNSNNNDCWTMKALRKQRMSPMILWPKTQVMNMITLKTSVDLKDNQAQSCGDALGGALVCFLFTVCVVAYVCARG